MEIIIHCCNAWQSPPFIITTSYWHHSMKQSGITLAPTFWSNKRSNQPTASDHHRHHRHHHDHSMIINVIIIIKPGSTKIVPSKVRQLLWIWEIKSRYAAHRDLLSWEIKTVSTVIKCCLRATCHVFGIIRIGLICWHLFSSNLQDPIFSVLGVICKWYQLISIIECKNQSSNIIS